MVLGKLPPNPNSNANPKPKPDPDQEAIFRTPLNIYQMKDYKERKILSLKAHSKV